MDAMEALVADRFERFGCAGNASRIKPITLSDMAQMYASGKL
jgi:fructose-bisphosphate aldolase class II